MAKTVGIVMDPIEAIKPQKDTSLALMLAAQSLGANLLYMVSDQLYVQDGKGFGLAHEIEVFDDLENWFAMEPAKRVPLAEMDVILMRKDPPVSKRFIHTCYMLEQAMREGVQVVNNPVALVAYNEKVFATHFPELCPPTVITSDFGVLSDFLQAHETIIIKPLDSMGGDGIFMVGKEDVNFEVIWESQTLRGTYPVVAQRFIPDIVHGDKRVIVIDGEPFPHVLVRTPKQGSVRGNMAAGGTTHVREINDAEREIALTVGKRLVKEGIRFAGLDVIGDKLIEINVTSPTGMRQISKACGEDVAMVLMRKVLA